MKKILCVDDVKTNLFTLEALFESNTQDMYEIITATSGREALGVLLTEKVDLILLDVMMPDLDGFETAQFILKNKKTKDIPIIYLTAKQDNDTISQCYAIGGADFISKPFNVEELLVKVNFHLELVENKETLDLEKKLLQDILDAQDNLVFITSGHQLIKMNKASKNFYSVSEVRELTAHYKCICDSFIKKDGYFHFDIVSEDEFWIDALVKELQTKRVTVLIKEPQSEEINSFDIQAKQFGLNYMVSLTNSNMLEIRSDEI